MIEGFSGVKIDDLKVTEVKVRNFTTKSAETSVVVLDPSGEPLGGDEDDYSGRIFEDDNWRITECDDL